VKYGIQHFEKSGVENMALELKNGAVVSRFFSDGSGELLAAFQYFCDAEMWAKLKVTKDCEDSMETTLVATCLYSGTSRQFKPTEPKK
jgi:hypothetical protein